MRGQPRAQKLPRAAQPRGTREAVRGSRESSRGQRRPAKSRGWVGLGRGVQETGQARDAEGGSGAGKKVLSGGWGRRPGSRGGGRRRSAGARTRGRPAAATYLLVRDPLRLLQAERTAEGTVLWHHAEAAGRAHQLLGIAACSHLGGHDAASAVAHRPRTGPSPAKSPAPPVRLTAPAPNRHVRSEGRANRRQDSALSLRSPICAKAPPLPPLKSITNQQ